MVAPPRSHKRVFTLVNSDQISDCLSVKPRLEVHQYHLQKQNRIFMIMVADL